MTSTENRYQKSRIIAVTKPDHVVLKPLELVYRRNLEEFGEIYYRNPNMV
jgi:hypothetical protein